VDHVRNGEYTIILGPRFSEKTFLLSDIADELRKLGMAPVLVNLESLEQQTGSKFIDALAETMADGAREYGEPPVLQAGDERELQYFFEALPVVLGRNVVLLFDQLEILPINSSVVLLRVLRALLTEAATRTPKYSVCAVMTSTFAVADVTLGPVSPFNVTQPVWIDDLDRDETKQLVQRIAAFDDIDTEERFGDAVYSITSGDRYAIALLCHYCAVLAKTSSGRQTVTEEDLQTATRWFIENADDYPPLRETRRSLDHDPESLLALVKILDQGEVPARELPISIARPEHFRLTGAVKAEITKSGTVYRPRNNLYARALAQYYHPARVSRVLFVAGRFREALEYLRRQGNLRTDRRIRAAFLDSITDSIFVARSVREATDSLAEYICAAFEMEAAAVYLVTRDRTTLRLISQTSMDGIDPEIHLDSGRMETRTYSSEHYVMDADHRRVGIPLREGRETSGIVVTIGFHRSPRDDDFAELVAFVSRIATALGRTLDLERRVDQLERLQTINRAVATTVDLQQVLAKTVEEGINAIAGAQRGMLLLYDDGDRRLHVRQQSGYRPELEDEVVVDPAGLSYVAAVFQMGAAMQIDNARQDSRVTARNDPDMAKQVSVLCVPLSAWGRRIGVFCVDNITMMGAFRPEDAQLLSAFASQAAIAIQNALVYQELYALSLRINSNDLEAVDVFRQAVRSVVRVTGAQASHMVLLRDRRDVMLSVAYGMGENFEYTFKPRPNGLTSLVLRRGEPVMIPSDDVDLGINPLAQGIGIRTSIGLPLSINEDILGVLFVNFSEPRAFSRDEIHVLALYANECAIAIDRSRREKQRLHAAVAWMGLDLSEMGHELTQAVNRLQSHLYLLSKNVPADSDLAGWVNAARKDAEVIAGLPQRALMPDRDRKVVFDLMELIRADARVWCDPQHGITLDLDGLIGTAPVSADRARMKRVVKLLMQNAVWAAKGSEARFIRIESRFRGNTIEILFANSGDPIPPEIQATLGHVPVRSKRGGMGAGFLIATSIVSGYDGDLRLVDSNENETAFRLSLPLETRDETDHSAR